MNNNILSYGTKSVAILLLVVGYVGCIQGSLYKEQETSKDEVVYSVEAVVAELWAKYKIDASCGELLVQGLSDVSQERAKSILKTYASFIQRIDDSAVRSKLMQELALVKPTHLDCFIQMAYLIITGETQHRKAIAKLLGDISSDVWLKVTQISVFLLERVKPSDWDTFLSTVTPLCENTRWLDRAAILGIMGIVTYANVQKIPPLLAGMLNTLCEENPLAAQSVIAEMKKVKPEWEDVLGRFQVRLAFRFLANRGIFQEVNT